MTSVRDELPRIGWREWLTLPDLGTASINVKVKVDTGARTSALHAFDYEKFRRRGLDWLRFSVHPLQREQRQIVRCEAEILDERSVKSSSGRAEVRWVVRAHAQLGGKAFPMELTLTRRDAMGFRMLLGREAVRDRFLVDSGASFVCGREPSKAKSKAKKTTSSSGTRSKSKKIRTR